LTLYEKKKVLEKGIAVGGGISKISILRCWGGDERPRHVRKERIGNHKGLIAWKASVEMKKGEGSAVSPMIRIKKGLSWLPGRKGDKNYINFGSFAARAHRGGDLKGGVERL